MVSGVSAPRIRTVTECQINVTHTKTAQINNFLWLSHRGKEVEQSVTRQRAHGETDAELNAQLEHAAAGRTQQHHDPEHGRQTDQHVGQGGIHESCREQLHISDEITDRNTFAS